MLLPGGPHPSKPEVLALSAVVAVFRILHRFHSGRIERFDPALQKLRGILASDDSEVQEGDFRFALQGLMAERRRTTTGPVRNRQYRYGMLAAAALQHKTAAGLGSATRLMVPDMRRFLSTTSGHPIPVYPLPIANTKNEMPRMAYRPDEHALALHPSTNDDPRYLRSQIPIPAVPDLHRLPNPETILAHEVAHGLLHRVHEDGLPFASIIAPSLRWYRHERPSAWNESTEYHKYVQSFDRPPVHPLQEIAADAVAHHYLATINPPWARRAGKGFYTPPPPTKSEQKES